MSIRKQRKKGVVYTKNKLVFGVGINDADYVVNPKYEPSCLYYKRWHQMLQRCYFGEDKAYEGVKVCEEWLTFSNFKKWMEKQDWEGKDLDKDIMGDSKLYSPDTCIFIEPYFNRLIKRSSYNKPSALGFYWNKEKKSFHIQVKDFFSKKTKHVKYCRDLQEALDCSLYCKLMFLEDAISYYELKQVDVKNALKSKIINNHQKLYDDIEELERGIKSKQDNIK